MGNAEDFRRFVADHVQDKLFLGLIGPPQPGVRLFFTAAQSLLRGKPGPDIGLLLWDQVLWGLLAVPTDRMAEANDLMGWCGLDGEMSNPQRHRRTSEPFPVDQEFFMLRSHRRVTLHGQGNAQQVLHRETALLREIETGKGPDPVTYSRTLWGIQTGPKPRDRTASPDEDTDPIPSAA